VTTGCWSPLARFKTGAKPGEKKAHGERDGACLDWALASFSGDVAADELYEGPYCVLSVVDKRCAKRILYDVLTHAPPHTDITAFLRRVKTALTDRDVVLQGLTTDGSPLSPEPIRSVFGAVAHHICTFHVLKERTHGIRRAVAAERNRLAHAKPKLKRGRPASQDKTARRFARKSKQIQDKISGLFQGRFFFVKRRLTPSERPQFLQITRGLPRLRKLREIMEHIYAVFDRRCRTQTALNKRKKRRHWGQRFTWIGDTLKTGFAPTLEKALTCLDDKLLPATSNAVERGNRRHRKMQKSVYRVRSQVSLEGRIALDMIRESRAEHRDRTTKALPQTRRGAP
jgi:hypothetical protein